MKNTNEKACLMKNFLIPLLVLEDFGNGCITVALLARKIYLQKSTLLLL
jgi:hypothetical protein